MSDRESNGLLHSQPGKARSSTRLIVTGGCAAIGLVVFLLLCRLSSYALALAHGASCTANMNQLATALSMYAQDCDGRLPRKGHWLDDLYPYVKNSGIDACPSRRFPYGYAFNALLDQSNVAKIASPQLTPALFESSLGINNGSDLLQSFLMPHPKGDGSPQQVGNVVFADGHRTVVTSAPQPSAGLPKSMR